eukprot:GILJ01025915.1.p1 GENE.GILJ01025915.1~~GILJ01025915.1.p1  ORF type:complete len:109 (+),score=4.22 GILJ01025915.1:2-328(+)
MDVEWFQRNLQRLSSPDLKPYIGWLELYSYHGDSMVNWYLRHGKTCDKETTSLMLKRLARIVKFTPVAEKDRKVIREMLSTDLLDPDDQIHEQATIVRFRKFVQIRMS